MSTSAQISLSTVIFFCFLILAAVPVADSSTIGVKYISRLLEIQDKERAPAAVQLSAAYGVLNRLIPSRSSSFEFRIISKDHCSGELCFNISNHPSSTQGSSSEILISGTTGVEVLSALNWYLKYWCGAHISWSRTGGAQLSSVPKSGSLPRVQDAGILVRRPTPWSYYQNAVTSSYSFAWWDWERWEKEIDWMALHGINLPLAFTGQEAIWQKVFKNFNISTSDLDDFFGGPAFLAWSRMGNLHGWGGSLPQSWLDQQLILQKKILARMHELGMTPVLPAFSGNVPAGLKHVFPSAKITRLGNCSGGLHHLHSMFILSSNWSKLYPKHIYWHFLFWKVDKEGFSRMIGLLSIVIPDSAALISLMQLIRCLWKLEKHLLNNKSKNMAEAAIYITDDPDYISSLGAATFRGMQSGDEYAVWLMQGWLFSYDPFWKPPQMKALLHSVPVGRMVVLDLFAEVKPIWPTSEQFYGIPYIWCMLHNFAANIEMYGVLDAVGSGPVEACISENSTMVGVGMSMEGIEQNPIVYDLMSEMAFHHDKVDVKKWVDLYATRRYGTYVQSMQDAWKILYRTVYNCTDGGQDKNRDVIVAFPDVDPSSIPIHQATIRRIFQDNVIHVSRRAILEEKLTDPFYIPHLWYSTAEVLEALRLFISSGDQLSEINTYRYDLIDLTRQALAKYANQLFLRVIEAYRLADLHAASSLSQEFLVLVEDLDTLLACHEGFLLGPWLESAKQLAQDEGQKRQFEWNARTQITMWFDNTEVEASLLRDYGNKYWSGLLRDYYGPRAAIYIKFLMESLEKGDGFRLTNWRREWIKLTNDWQSSRKLFPVRSSGDALNVSKWLYEKYFQESSKKSKY